MGYPVQFPGSNRVLRPPEGHDEVSVRSMHTFTNGFHSVSCWQFDKDEIEEIVRTGRLFCSVLSGQTQPPIYLGTEQETRNLIADVGVWKRT